MNSYIDKLFLEQSKKSGKTEHVIQVPISRITSDFPILGKLWNEYKGMCNYGTNPTEQTILLNNVINRNKYFLAFNNGENQSNLRKGDILDCPLLVPPLTRQKQIVQKLDALSAKTKKLEAIYTQKIADLEEMKKSVLQKAFSGQLNTIN